MKAYTLSDIARKYKIGKKTILRYFAGVKHDSLITKPNGVTYLAWSVPLAEKTIKERIDNMGIFSRLKNRVRWQNVKSAEEDFDIPSNDIDDALPAEDGVDERLVPLDYTDGNFAKEDKTPFVPDPEYLKYRKRTQQHAAKEPDWIAAERKKIAELRAQGDTLRKKQVSQVVQRHTNELNSAQKSAAITLTLADMQADRAERQLEERIKKLTDPRDGQGRPLRRVPSSLANTEAYEIDWEKHKAEQDAIYKAAGVMSPDERQAKHEAAWRTFRQLEKMDGKAAEEFREKNKEIMGKYAMLSA